jgi:hypothetical protein
MAFFEGREFREKDRCSCRGVDHPLPRSLRNTNDPELRGRMGTSARTLPKRVFSVEAVARLCREGVQARFVLVGRLDESSPGSRLYHPAGHDKWGTWFRGLV